MEFPGVVGKSIMRKFQLSILKKWNFQGFLNFIGISKGYHTIFQNFHG